MRRPPFQHVNPSCLGRKFRLQEEPSAEGVLCGVVFPWLEAWTSGYGMVGGACEGGCTSFSAVCSSQGHVRGPHIGEWGGRHKVSLLSFVLPFPPFIFT
jgi:hypothetical protein